MTAIEATTVPCNIEAEESVIGALLIDSEAIAKVASFLHADDFYRERHALIYRLRLELFERRHPGDFVTMCDELERKGQLEDVGGPSYLSSLIANVPTSAHVEHYAHIVERCGLMRRLIRAAGQIAALAYQNPSDVEETLDRGGQLLFAVSQRRLSQEFVPIDVALKEYFDQIDYLHEHKGEIIGVPTGFQDLDRLTQGLQAADLIVLAGGPAAG